MKRVLFWIACGCGIPGTAVAQLAQSFPFETPVGGDCDPNLGRVQVDVDPFGAFGTSVEISGNQAYDPALDAPDQGYVDTVYESMAFLCVCLLYTSPSPRD